MVKMVFRSSRSVERPSEIDVGSSAYTVYIRKNITPIMVKNEQDDGEHEEFVFEEAKISKQQYEQYVLERDNEEAHTEQELATAELAEQTESEMTENMIALADLAESTDEQNTDNLIAIGDLGDAVDQLSTDTALASAELYEQLESEIQSLSDRISELESKINV